MERLNRRDVLRGLALASAVAVLPGLAWRRSHALAEQPLAARLCQLFAHPDSASIVGRRYLAQVPQEASAEKLITLIGRTPENQERLANADAAELRKLLVAQQCDEFRERRTVSLDGWVLSETEARLCALAAVQGR